MFAKYHYLDCSHNNAAHVFIATVNEVVCAFCSVINYPGRNRKDTRHVHRLVVLPEYQGIGIGTRLLNFIGQHYLKMKLQFRIVTSNPALIYSLKKQTNWICVRKEFMRPDKILGNANRNRMITGWRRLK